MFKMRKLREVIPHDSDWPMLYDDQLPNITFYHKWKQGNVDATFFRYLIPHLIEVVPKHISIKDHKKSFSLRISSNRIDRTTSFEDQVEAIREGLDNLNILRDWLIHNSFHLNNYK